VITDDRDPRARLLRFAEELERQNFIAEPAAIRRVLQGEVKTLEEALIPEQGSEQAERISQEIIAKIDAKASKVLKRPLALNDPRFIDHQAKAAIERASSTSVAKVRQKLDAPARKPYITLKRLMDAARVEVNRHASSQDRPDELQKLIIDIVSQQPDATTSEVLAALKRYPPGQVIESVSDDGATEWTDDRGKVRSDAVIEWNNANGKVIYSPIKSLKDRVSRAKKKC
jgi:hypothetical protein